MKKRLLSILITLCMVMCAIAPLVSYANPGASASGAYGALLTPDTNPPAGWEKDASNPYGTKKGQPFALTPWYEPIIYSYRNAENEAAKDHTKVYDKLTLGKNIIESPSGTYSVSSVDNVAFAVGLAYDPLGTGRNDHAIFVGFCDMDNKNLTAKVCYWVQNLVTNKRSDLQKIADAPKWACKDTRYGELEYQEFRHYFNVTAGDYDGDGKMTAVITYAGNDDLWGIAGTGIAGEQGLSRKSFVKSKGTDDAYFSGWNTTKYERDQITKSLASADIDRDGCDELFVYAGVAEPDKIDGKDKELSSDSFRKAVSKLSVYKAKSGNLKRIDQKSLMTLNREDEQKDGSRYYDHIRYGNLAAGDINGDGWQEIIIAGYFREVREEKQKGFIWDKKTDGNNMGFAVYYGQNNSITNVQKTSMSGYTANGTNDLGVKPKPAMTSVAINGRGTPKQVWIAGGLYEVQQNGALNLLCDTTRERNSSAKWWWYQDVIAGNFDHNTEGREQVIALAAERQKSVGQPNARKFDLFTDVFYGENFGSGTLSVAGKYTATAEKDEYSKLCHDADLAWDMPYNCILLAGDVNKDGLFARYEGKGYGYSDAQVQAVLQAAPYFSEIGDYDLDFSDGSTTYTFSSGYSDTKSSSHNTSFGASIVVQGDLKVWRYEASLGYTMDFTKSTEDTLSKEYSVSFNAGGNDSVVLYRVPATTYYYSIYDPQKGDFDLSEKNTIALMIPGQPVYTMLDREYYDEFAVLYNETYKKDIAAGKAKALPILTNSVLPENAEGDPFAYWSNPGSTDKSVTKFESLSKQKYELGFGASSITNEWTTSKEHAEGVEVAHGFSASMKSTWGADYFNMGFAIDFSYSNAKGTVYTTTESSGASGTVNNIDRRSLLSSYGIGYDVSSQYGFTWDFGMRTWTAGDQNIPVFGYVLTNLRAAPPVPTLTGVSVTDNQSTKITWEAPKEDIRRPFAGYHIWMRMDDGEFERVTETPLSSETLSYTYSSLQADTTYTFAVSTVGSNGLASALSNTKTFSTFAGTGGREIEFRNNGSSIQWRYVGESDDAYRDLVSLAELTGNDGADGKQIELRVYNGFIQWKYSDDSVWNDLIALSDLKGEKGDKGDKGDKGEKGDKGDKGDPGQDGKDGTNGANGASGADGKDGVTPKLKIGDDNFWYVSYDDGQTWVSLGVKATGEKGDTGEAGQQGEKGDKGDKGDPGQDGKDGTNGASGANGTNGANGASGADGKDGAPGKDGIDGKDGTSGADGKDGVGIAKAEINANGELVLTYTDGTTANLGKVVGADGKDGLTPFIGENGNWWIGEKDTGVKAAVEAVVPVGSGNISASASAVSPALIAVGSVAGLALLGNLGSILYIILKKKRGSV